MSEQTPVIAPQKRSGKLKTIVKGVLAVAAAVASLSGAGKIISGAWDWWNTQNAPQTEFDRTPNAGLEFWQGDTAAPMFYRDDKENVVRVQMKPASFVIRLPKVDKDTAVEICAWTDESIFQLAYDKPADDVTYLQQGRGVADTEFSSGRLYLDNEARNYLIGNRLRTQGEQSQVFVSRLSKGKDRDTLLRDQRTPLYLSVFIDRNHDRIMGDGEFEQVELDF